MAEWQICPTGNGEQSVLAVELVKKPNKSTCSQGLGLVKIGLY